MFTFYAYALLILLLATGAYWLWKRHINAELAEGAAIEWARLQKTEPTLLAGLSEASFLAVYHKVHGPRFPAYALAAFATFVLSFPVTLAVLTGLSALIYTSASPPVDVAHHMHLDGEEIKIFGQTLDEKTRHHAALYYLRDLSGFHYFFGILFSWLAIVGFYVRRFHTRLPGYLREEIIRART